MAKSKAAAPKKAGGGGGSKFDFQQFLLDKGEKIGLIVAGVAFALFAILGVMAMSGAANPSKLSSELKGGAERIDAQLRETLGETPPPADVPPGDITFVKVKPSQFVTPNELFNTSGTITEKRNNPIVLAINGGEAVFAQGGIPVYDIQENNIATVQGRERSMNNVRAIDIEKLRKRQEKLRAKLGLPPPSATPVTPTPGGPPAGGPPAAPPGPPGGGRGPGAAIPQKRTDDAEIVYVSLDSPTVNNAELALNLAPTRMAVIRGIVPYKKQVGKFLQALRVESDSALEGEGSAPLYRGFSVERQTLKADGKTVEKDWTPFDPIDAARDLYRLAAALEPEDPKYEPFIPDATHKLYLPRPKFTRMGSPPPAMPELGQALQELEKTGPPKDLTDREKKLKGKDNLFDLRPQSPAPTAPGGLPPGTIPGMPPGATRGGPPGPMARGGSDGPRGGPGPGLASNPSRNSASPVWMLQFIDPTIEPGKCYRYRIQLKLTNPNYNKKDLVAYPGLAQQEELQSDWAEIPGVVSCPPDEHLYAAGEKAKDRALIGTADFDTTTLRFHRWYDFVRVSKDAARGDVVAEWVVADVDAKRGQYVHQEKSFKLPLWSMFTGSYIFRDRISVVGKGQSATVRAKMENVKMNFDTSEPVLVVDFDGGKGAYRLPNGNSLVDECTVETLLLSGIDGANLRLELRNAATDKEDVERRAREESWQRWLEEVRTGPDPAPAGGSPRAG